MAVGEAWRGLSDEHRHPYTQRAKADRKRYEEQLCAIARSAAAAASADAAATSVVDAAARTVPTADTR